MNDWDSDRTQVKVIAPLNTPVNVAEHIGPDKLVDQGMRVVNILLQIGDQKVSIMASLMRGSRFVKDHCGQRGDLIASLNHVVMLTPHALDVNGDYLKAFSDLRDTPVEICLMVAVFCKFTDEDSTLTFNRAVVEFKHAIADGGMHLFRPSDERYQQIKQVADQITIVECEVEVPTWNKPNLAGLVVRPEKLIFANGTHEELLSWIADTSRQMQDPQLSAQGEEMWLEDAAEGGNRYHIVNDWATKPMTYQVIKD
jgi:hypothetical protein